MGGLCVCVYVCAWTCIFMSVQTRGWCQVCSSLTLHRVLRQSPSLEPRAHDSPRLDYQLAVGSLVSTSIDQDYRQATVPLDSSLSAETPVLTLAWPVLCHPSRSSFSSCSSHSPAVARGPGRAICLVPRHVIGITSSGHCMFPSFCFVKLLFFPDFIQRHFLWDTWRGFNHCQSSLPPLQPLTSFPPQPRGSPAFSVSP